MKEIGSYEAKTHLPRLLKELSAGQTYTITKNGRPVARLIPPENIKLRKPEKVIADIQALKTKTDCSEISMEDLCDAIREGRR